MYFIEICNWLDYRLFVANFKVLRGTDHVFEPQSKRKFSVSVSSSGFGVDLPYQAIYLTVALQRQGYGCETPVRT